MKKVKKTKILITNFGGLGDQILSFPAIKAMKAHYADAHVTLITRPASKHVRQLTSLVDEVIISKKMQKYKYLELVRLFIMLFIKRYDVFVSFYHTNFDTAFVLLSKILGFKETVGFEFNDILKKRLTKPVKHNPDQYYTNKLLDLSASITGEKKIELPEIELNEKYVELLKRQLEADDKQIITIHPGCSKISKKINCIKSWTEENWAVLIIKLLETGKYKVILSGGPDDEEVISLITERLKAVDTGNLIDMYGKTQNLAHFAALVSVSDLLVCIDSAPMHIAVAVKTPVTAIFGPTNEKTCLPDNDERFTAVTVNNLECRPCLWDKRKTTCEELHCLNIDPEKIFKLIEEKSLTGAKI